LVAIGRLLHKIFLIITYYLLLFIISFNFYITNLFRNISEVAITKYNIFKLADK